METIMCSHIDEDDILDKVNTPLFQRKKKTTMVRGMPQTRLNNYLGIKCQITLYMRAAT